jgi:multicomponent Na+:H+ antiporter subunit G
MLDLIVIVLLSAGILFFFGTINGLLRFPDFYTRMHAAGKGDTLSTVLMLLGLALYAFHDPSVQDFLTGYKIIFIAVLIAIASPTATHALMDAGYASGIEPWGGETDAEEEVDK